MKILAFVACFFLPLASFSQKKLIDSLEHQLLVLPQDSNRLEALNTLSFKLKYAQPDKAIKYSEEGENLAQQLKDLPGLAKNYYCRGYIYYGQGEHEKALHFLDQALKIAKENDLVSRQAYCHAVKAMVYLRTSKYDQGIEENKISAELFKQTKDTLTLAAILNNTASIYEERGQYDTALVYYFESLNYKTASGNRHFATTEMANIGACYTMLGEYDLSFQYNQMGLDQARTTSNLFSHLKANRGNTFLKMGNLDSALTCGWIAYEMDIHNKVPYFLLNSTKLLGEVFEKKNEPQKAIRFFSEGMEVAKKLKNLDFQASIGCRLGNLHLLQKEYKNAKLVLEDAFRIAEEIKSYPQLECTSSSLARVFEAVKEWERALFYQKKSETFQDSLTSLEKSIKLVELEKKYRSAQQAKEIAQKDLTILGNKNRERKFLLGGLLVILFLVGIFQYLQYRTRLRKKEAEIALQLEKNKIQQLQELDQLKSNFFANISHEFRTPLTLILGPLHQLKNKQQEEGISISKNHVEVISRNANRLLQLINQLLDLSKLESGKMQLRVKKEDVVKYLRSTVYSFESLAEKRNIHFQAEFPDGAVMAFFDKDKLGKIINNLLSNAFKFTPEQGNVTVKASFQDERLRMTISDSGTGIPQDELEKIFDRFYQIQGTDDRGSGIGLSLVKELVNLHKGKISVESEYAIGTQFTIILPMGKRFFDPGEILENEIIDKDFDHKVAAGRIHLENTIPVNVIEKSMMQQDTRPLILVVEDNWDLRNFMIEMLDEYFQIITAENGEIGFQKAISVIPDLIISDVMMPKLNGLDLCSQLKSNEKTSHIPVILLTAKADLESKIKGLETKADDYLTKPFEEKELLVRVQNLIEQRRILRTRFSKEIKLEAQKIAITSADEIFINKVLTAIEEHLGDSTFSVETLGKLVGMSRSQLHRKLTALCAQSPSFLIRKMRLQRGKDLLENGAGTISEIAYQVGFSSPAYFTKCFHDQYGKAPSEIK